MADIDNELLNNLNNNMPWDSIDDIPEFLDVSCDALVEVTEVTTTFDKEKNNRAIYQVKVQVVEPTEIAGEFNTERFYIGTEDDPFHNEAETWNKFPARMLKSLLKSANMAGTNLSEMLRNLVGRKLGIEYRWQKPTADYPNAKIQANHYRPLIDSKGKPFVPKLRNEPKPEYQATGLGPAAPPVPSAPMGGGPATGMPKPPPKA